MKRVIPELLVGMQGAREAKNTLLVLAATNRPWDLDSAFLRPGRFDVAIHIPLPDQAARRAILKMQLSQVPGAEALDLDDLVRGSEGFSGADMVHLCERLKDHAIERIIEGEGEMLLTKADVEYALANVSSSVLPEDLRSIEKYRVGRMGGGI